MLKRGITATVVLGTSALLASFAVFHARTTTPQQAAQLATTAPEGTPPPFPHSVLIAPMPPEAGGKCALQGLNAPPGVAIAKETTVAQLAVQSDEIVVATAVRQVAYWQTGRWGDRAVWQPMTMTEYHVTSVLKGTPGAWLQLSEAGASSDALSTCRDFARTVVDESVATVNQQYVLFLKFNPETGRFGLWAGPMDIFPVIGGRVYTAATVHPYLNTQVVYGYEPESLSRFVASLSKG